MYSYELELGGISLPVSFFYPETAERFGAYCRPGGQDGGGLALTAWDWAFGDRGGLPRSADSEYSLFAGAVSAALLDRERFLFHAAAVGFRGRAWLIAAPSGVGKSTQVRNLRELWPGQFEVICGDRPLVGFRGEEAVVYPSPWNGKEGWNGGEAAPLGGIICLRRGKENEVNRMRERDAALPVYCAVIHNGASEAMIRTAAALTERLLQCAGAWLLVSRDVPDSTRLLYERVFSQEEV